MEEINSGNSELDAKISEYLQFAAGLSTGDEVRRLVQEGRFDLLRRVMMQRLTFGTAGLRGRMGPGYLAMNDLVVVQTSQGLAAYLDGLRSSGQMQGDSVVIGFDQRHNSERFAALSAVAFLSRGLRVHLFSRMVPTPLVPYAVRRLGCCAGIMITASHNPKDENGYKVYWSNGAQILPPHDQRIQESIERELAPWGPGALSTTLPWTSPLCSDPSFDVPNAYFEELAQNCSLRNLCCGDLKVTLTSLHGVGHAFVKHAFQVLGFERFVPVPQQMVPDPDFPTVTFPNPEERNCLNHSIETAEASGSRLILANDPDVDRLAVAEKLHDGSWHIYHGNEIGALLGYWLWESLSPEYKANAANCFMVSSTVSSKILRSISQVEGFRFCETLTGFKWMANKADDLMAQGKTFVLAFEEAIGYMCGKMVLDKDGISAAMHVTRLAAHAYDQGKILHDLLTDVYAKYGFHTCCNSYFICHDPAKISAMFDRLRNFNAPNQYPECLPGGFRVSGVRDLTTGYDSTQPQQRAVLPISASSQMITFYFENGCEATLRTSGTEPKVKYYTEMIARVPEQEWSGVSTLLKDMVQLIVDHWMEPEKNGFQARPV